MNKYFHLIIILLLSGKLLIADSVDNYFRVTSLSGVVLREKPFIKSKFLEIIPYNSKGKILDSTKNKETIQGKNGHWIKVNYLNLTGWIFTGFLQLSADEYFKLFSENQSKNLFVYDYLSIEQLRVYDLENILNYSSPMTERISIGEGVNEYFGFLNERAEIYCNYIPYRFINKNEGKYFDLTINSNSTFHPKISNNFRLFTHLSMSCTGEEHKTFNILISLKNRIELISINELNREPKCNGDDSWDYTHNEAKINKDTSKIFILITDHECSFIGKNGDLIDTYKYKKPIAKHLYIIEFNKDYKYKLKYFDFMKIPKDVLLEWQEATKLD